MNSCYYRGERTQQWGSVMRTEASSIQEHSCRGQPLAQEVVWAYDRVRDQLHVHMQLSLCTLMATGVSCRHVNSSDRSEAGSIQVPGTRVAEASGVYS